MDGDWLGLFAGLSLFRRHRKTPVECVVAVADSLGELQALYESDTVDGRQLQFYGLKPRRRICKHLRALKASLLDSAPPSHQQQQQQANVGKELNVLEIIEAVMSERLTLRLVRGLRLMDFESRKDAVSVISCLLRKRQGIRMPMAEALLMDEPSQLRDLCRALVPRAAEAQGAGVMLFQGMLLREFVSYELLLEAFLRHAGDLVVDELFPMASLPTFDVASDAMASLKVHQIS